MTDDYTKGKATTARLGNPVTDPTWLILIGDEIRFQTVGDNNNEANAKEFARRWNSLRVEGI